MTKDELKKIKPLTFIEVKYDYAPNEVVLLMDTFAPINYLKCAYEDGTVECHIHCDQVVRAIKGIEFPKI